MNKALPKLAEKSCQEPATQNDFLRGAFPRTLPLNFSMVLLFLGAPRQTPRHVCEETKRGRGQDGGSNVKK